MAGKPDEVRFGRHLFRVARTTSGYMGIVVGRSLEQFSAETRADLIKKLERHALSQEPEFFGYDGARTRFLRLFPGGLADPRFIGEAKSGGWGELAYKREMSARLRRDLPLEQALADGAGAAPILRAFDCRDLIDWREKDKLDRVLEGPRATSMVETLVRFAIGDAAWACDTLRSEHADDGLATWPVLTGFAFLWDPDRHALLRPEAAQHYARRVGHPLLVRYRSPPNPETYALYLDMLDETRRAISDLGPVDYIDLQSLAWVVSKYPEPAA